MSRFVALLRGVNVGGAKRVPMAAWRASLEALGCTRVQTLLNSGNAVFDAARGTPVRHAAQIRTALVQDIGVDALVVVKTAANVAAMVAENRLAAETDNPSLLLAAMTQDPKLLAALSALTRVDGGREKLLLGQHAAYLWCPDGSLQSRAASALMTELKDQGTTRNWATMLKIDALLA